MVNQNKYTADVEEAELVMSSLAHSFTRLKPKQTGNPHPAGVGHSKGRRAKVFEAAVARETQRHGSKARTKAKANAAKTSLPRQKAVRKDAGMEAKAKRPEKAIRSRHMVAEAGSRVFLQRSQCNAAGR